MIDFDSLRDKAEDFAEEHADQIDKGIDQAARVAGKKYGHGQQIEQGADKLKDFLPGSEDEERPRRPGEPGGQRRGQGGGHGGGHGGGARGRQDGGPGRPDRRP